MVVQISFMYLSKILKKMGILIMLSHLCLSLQDSLRVSFPTVTETRETIGVPYICWKIHPLYILSSKLENYCMTEILKEAWCKNYYLINGVGGCVIPCAERVTWGEDAANCRVS